jgi:S1-C subfamily serine protease
MIASTPPTQNALSIAPAVDEALQRLYQRVRQSVVLLYRNGSNGAGVIWRPDGLIVTNNHVVSGEGKMQVVLPDGRSFVGIVAARHPTRDLALIKVAGQDLPAIEVGDSASVRAGELAIAVGHPRGYRDAVTAGIIVAAGHSESIEGAARGDLIQTDAQFAPGNSGGPLVDHRGRVIGICTRVAGRLGMAIPSAAVVAFAGATMAQGSKAYIGVSGQVVPLRRQDFATGFLFTDVAQGGPADRAGMMIGDIIVEIGGLPVTDRESVPAALLRSNPLEPLPVTILRGGAVCIYDITPAAQELSDPAGTL